ncbi:MAG: peptide-methionine (S)-S-oxide reductase MsrA [Gallionellaceae bacterium]|jgi:peptide-methionine (S)-S-oxide reductase
MSDKQIATLAGGCFWCLEAVYEQMKGVEKVVSGYIAGEKPNPTYEEVCSGNSGHAEAVQISFDPAQVSYGELLSVFFTIHDPTTLNRQGNDKGTQYRSAIFYHNEDQRAEAAELMLELRKQHIFPAPLVTELVAASTFYPAESYHQHYYANHPEQGYCQFVVAPKLKKFKEHFSAKMK